MINTREIITKYDFITQIKKSAISHLEKVADIYINDNIINIIKSFYKIQNLNNLDIKEYEVIEIQCTNLIEKILKKQTAISTHAFNLLIGSLLFILGVCQLAQDKKFQAQINLE